MNIGAYYARTGASDWWRVVSICKAGRSVVAAREKDSLSTTISWANQRAAHCRNRKDIPLEWFDTASAGAIIAVRDTHRVFL
jgi:hypothetical protein